MAYTFLDLQGEVKRRGLRDQAGTQFDTATNNLINTSLFRVSREAFWKPLRRSTTFSTKAKITTGTVSATNGSTTFTFSSATLITSGVHIGQRLTVSGSSLQFIIQTITSETVCTTDRSYDGTTASGLTYTLYGREDYTLPIQTGRVAFLWHEEYDYPYVMRYMPGMRFYQSGVPVTTGNIPTHYRMWGEDDVLQQPLEASVTTVVSSSASDTDVDVTVFGIVSGYPDFETINTNGTSSVAGTKSFSSIERVTKSVTSVGRITITTNSGNVTVAVLPVGDTAGHIQYKHIQLYPLPETAFPMHVQYYKDPWRLVNSNDMHELGSDFDEAIILLSVAKIKAENSQTEADGWFELYKDELRSLKKVNADKLDHIPVLDRSGQELAHLLIHPQLSFAQVGGYYGPHS